MMVRRLIIFWGLIVSATTQAQTSPDVDLSLTYETIPPMPWRLGQEGVLRATVKNLSTNAATNSAYLRGIPPSPPNVLPIDVFLIPVGQEISTCQVSFFCLPATCYDMPRIEPGETKVCDFPRYAAERFGNPGNRRLRVEMIFNGDPDVSNNEAQITAGILANPTVPSGGKSSIWLAGLTLLIGLVMVSRRGE
jgi:hypothetical protein